MVDVHRSSLVEKEIATRRLSRYYPWILSGLFLLYFITFPVFKAPILISVPVLVTAWFYYRRAGLIASILSIFINLILIETFVTDPQRRGLSNSGAALITGSLFLILVSFGTGYLRELIENLYKRELMLQSEERFLALLGIIIKKILEHSSWSTLNEDHPSHLFFDIIHHLTNLFIADSGHLIGLEANPARALLLASTNSAQIPPAASDLDPVEARIASHALETGQILAIENLLQSPYMTMMGDSTNSVGLTRAALCIPIMAREYKFGAAVLAYEAERAFSIQETIFAERIGHQIALALWGLRQDQLNIQQLDKTLTMVKVGQALSETERIGLDTVLQLIVDSARNLIPHAEQAVIHLVDADENSLIARAISGFDPSKANSQRLRMQLGEGVAGQVLRDGVAINIGDIHTDPRFLQTGEQVWYSSLLVAPVQTSGRQIGTISVEGRSTHAFSEQETELLEALGSQAAIVIENTRLFETTAHSLDELSALYQINQRLVASLDPDTLMKEVVDLLQESFHYYHVQVYLMDAEQQVLSLGQGSGEIGIHLKSLGHCLQLGQGIAGHVAQTRKPFYTNDVNKLDFYLPSPFLRGTKSELAAPIKIDDAVLGVLDIQQIAPHRLTERDMQIASAVAEQLAVALQKAGLYANLQTALEHEKNMRSQLIQSERLSLMGKLLASVSHELNNPLQTIQNAMFLIRDDLHHANIHLEDMDIIASEIDRMAMLLERLRSTYRPLHPEDFGPVQINDIIEDTHKLLSTYLRHKNVTSEFLADRAVPPVTGLGNHLRQVMLNLFINAVEAMPDGGHFCVETAVVAAGHEVVFSITDSGIGIEPELLPKIFDPFVTNKKTGTGLGLTITHEIVEQHQGRIVAENVPGGGAKLTVWLPVWKELGG